MWCCSDLSSPIAGHPGGFKQRSWSSRDPLFLSFALMSASPMSTKAFALTRESLFFVWPKKSNPKKGHPGGTPFALRATGARWLREFSEGTSLCRPKTARIVRAALRVYPATIAVPQGPRKGKNSNSRPCPIRALPFPIPRSAFPGCQR